MSTEPTSTTAPVQPIVRKRARMSKAFRDEIKCWKLSMDEDAMLRSFMACVAIRMQGGDPETELGLTR